MKRILPVICYNCTALGTKCCRDHHSTPLCVEVPNGKGKPALSRYNSQDNLVPCKLRPSLSLGELNSRSEGKNETRTFSIHSQKSSSLRSGGHELDDERAPPRAELRARAAAADAVPGFPAAAACAPGAGAYCSAASRRVGRARERANAVVQPPDRGRHRVSWCVCSALW